MMDPNTFSMHTATAVSQETVCFPTGDLCDSGKRIYPYMHLSGHAHVLMDGIVSPPVCNNETSHYNGYTVMWPEAMAGTAVEVPCYDMPVVGSVVIDEERVARRFCNEDGFYEEPDIRDCTS